MNTISVSMIVRDEEENLERCLKSIRPYVDEIIVVDTGSRDKSVEIAERYGARVYHHPWENDFALHRNQSLSYATGDWILKLDADEELFPTDGPELRRTVASGEADYYYCEFHDIKSDGTEHGVFYQVRLFRNHRGMKFERRIHEKLTLKGKEGYARIRFRHYGYFLSPEKMEEKHNVRVKILLEMLKREPQDVYSLNQLASAYSMHRDYAEAIRHGEIALEMRRRRNLKESFFLTTYYTVGQGYLALGKLEEAKKTFLEALDFYPYHLDACYLLTLIYFEQKDLKKFEHFSKRFLEIHEAVEKNPHLLYHYYCHNLDKKKEVLFRLAGTYFSSNDEKSAAEILQLTFEKAGRPAELAESIAFFCAHEKKEDLSIEWLAKAWESGREGGTLPQTLKEDPRLFLHLGLFYEEKKRIDEAIACLKEAKDDSLSFEEKLQKEITLFSILWKKGEVEASISHLSSLVTLSGAKTLILIDKLEDIGIILYDITEALSVKGNRYLALLTLKLAVEIYPQGFDRKRFVPLLEMATRHSGTDVAKVP